jgi:hypothetical protein|tara:strand:- start:639 stop:827 length:189 start_codon:yes stop_codon:yes gene_type:complete
MNDRFDYQVKKLIQQRVEEQKENLLSRSLSSYEQYQYELGKLHALEHLLIDYQELNKKVIEE